MATSRKIVLLIGAEAISALLGWLAIKLILLQMGKAALGELYFALATVGGFTFLALLGFTQSHIKRVSEGQDLGSCIGTFGVIRATQLAILACAVLGSLAIWLYVLDKPLTDASPMMMVVILIHYLLFFGSGVPRATFTGLEESTKVTLPNLMGSILRLGLMCLVALWGLSVIYLGYAYVIGGLASGLLFFFFLRGYPAARWDRGLYDNYFKFAKPLMVVVFITTLASFIDKIVLGIFYEAGDLGAFVAEQRFIALIITISASVEALLYPQLSSLYARTRDAGLLRERVHLAERWLGLFIIPIIAVIWALPEPIMMVFLSQEVVQTEGSVWLLRVLGLTYLVRVLGRPYSVTLKAIDRTDLVASLSLVSGLLIIGLNLILVPERITQLDLELPGWGAMGAATALLTAALVLYIGRQVQNHRCLGLTSSPALAVLLVGGGATMLGVAYLGQLMEVQRWYEVGLVSLLGLGFFWSLMALLGQFGREDIKFILDTLNPTEMGRYMARELKEKRVLEGPEGARSTEEDPSGLAEEGSSGDPDDERSK